MALKSFTTIGNSIKGVFYSEATKFLHVKADGVNLSGYDFSGVTVSVQANNVTIKNSKFDASAGVYSVIQAKGKTGLTVDHCTFDGLKLNKNFGAFVSGQDGKVTVTYNTFLNAPADAIQLKSGVVDHNYLSGSGYANGAHADGIWVGASTGPVAITNNFVDARKPADAVVTPNNAIRITNELGDTKDVKVSGNIFLGGTYTVSVETKTAYGLKGVSVEGNFVGGGLYGDLYPINKPADLKYLGNISLPGVSPDDFGVPVTPPPPAPPPLVEVGKKIFGNPAVNGEVLQGTSGNDWVYGNGGGDKLIGGGGRDCLFSGKGQDIFVYKAVTDSAGKNTDVIGGYQAGIDRIDLKTLAGKDGLTFIGDAAFAGKAGSVHTVKTATSTWVEADINGDRIADLRIELQGKHNLSAIDFLL